MAAFFYLKSYSPANLLILHSFRKYAEWMEQKVEGPVEGPAEAAKSFFPFTFVSSCMSSIVVYFQAKFSESADVMTNVIGREASALKSKAVETFTTVKTKVGEIFYGTMNAAGEIYLWFNLQKSRR